MMSIVVISQPKVMDDDIIEKLMAVILQYRLMGNYISEEDLVDFSVKS